MNDRTPKDEINGLPDELNPAYIFSMTHISLLLQAAHGDIDLYALVRKEIADHGFGINGEWVGFKEAAKQWEAEGVRTSTVYNRHGRPVRVTIPA